MSLQVYSTPLVVIPCQIDYIVCQIDDSTSAGMIPMGSPGEKFSASASHEQVFELVFCDPWSNP